MHIKNILIVRKKTFFEFCFLEKNRKKVQKRMRLSAKEIKQFQSMHSEHCRAISQVESVLRKQNISYTNTYRKENIQYKKYDFIITIGGDGTFLQAAKGIKNQIILGVNSDPKRSVGKFCAAARHNFESIFSSVLNDKLSPVHLHRFQVKLASLCQPINVLNDILVCDENSGAMSRYVVQLNGKKETQRSSGIWFATPAGSTGAISSAGGKILNPLKKQIQYRPRELYYRNKNEYLLTGGMIDNKKIVSIRSLMRHGIIYFDGAHDHALFQFGDRACISSSANPLKVILAP